MVDQWAPPWPVPFSVSCSNKLADRDSEAVRVSRKCRCQPPCLGPGVGITTGGFSFSLEWGVGIERSGTPSDGNATQLDPGLVGLFALRSGGGGGENRTVQFQLEMGVKLRQLFTLRNTKFNRTQPQPQKNVQVRGENSKALYPGLGRERE